jgi:hypothetical protein
MARLVAWQMVCHDSMQEGRRKSFIDLPHVYRIRVGFTKCYVGSSVEECEQSPCMRMAAVGSSQVSIEPALNRTVLRG